MSDAQGVNEPTVCCVMLTRDRPEMAARAVRCFQRQTYERKKLLVYDTGEKHLEGVPFVNTEFALQRGPIRQLLSLTRYASIGSLRNSACDLAGQFMGAEIICHWDDDDYSHPYRIAEQVNLLMTSKKQVVGYRDMLFWRTTLRNDWDRAGDAYCPDEAWLYYHPHPSYCLGTSLCYWRKTWERKPFGNQPRPGKMTGEDHDWLEGLDSLGETSLYLFQGPSGSGYVDFQPRMIATIHGGNSSRQYENLEAPTWGRVPQWDSAIRHTMEEA